MTGDEPVAYFQDPPHQLPVHVSNAVWSREICLLLPDGSKWRNSSLCHLGNSSVYFNLLFGLLSLNNFELCAKEFHLDVCIARLRRFRVRSKGENIQKWLVVWSVWTLLIEIRKTLFIIIRDMRRFWVCLLITTSASQPKFASMSNDSIHQITIKLFLNCNRTPELSSSFLERL